MINSIDCLLPKYDYTKDNCYLIFYHQAKPTQTKEIKAEWFDFNYGEKVLWLLIRELTNSDKPRYRNIKFKNIDSTVKMVVKTGQKSKKKGLIDHVKK